MKKKEFWFFILKCAALIIVTALAYSSALEGRYIWDDDYLVFNNPLLHNIEGLRRIWFDLGSRVQYYPLVFSGFWAGYQLWGLNPLGYHLLNVFLHIFNALLLWRLCRQLKIEPAFVIALIFAVHPVHVESVAWISELKNVLSGFFFLSGLSVYLSLYKPDEEWQMHFSWPRYALAFMLYMCALLSKTVTCSFIVVVLLIVWWKRGSLKKQDWVPGVPFFLAGIILGLMTVRMEVHNVGAKGAEWSLLWYEHLFVACRALWFYVSKLVWPHPLMFVYPRWDLNPTDLVFYFCIAGCLAVAFFAWQKRKTPVGRAACLALAYYCVVLFPALGFFNLYPMRFSFVADHFQYLASIGPLAFFIASISGALRKKKVPQQYKEVLVVVSVFILTVLTWQQGTIYKDRLALFTDTFQKNPQCWMAYNNRGDYYFGHQQFHLAEKDFVQALDIKFDYPDAHNNQGLISAQKKKYEEAIKSFNLAIYFKPRFFEAYGNRSVVYRKLGQLDKALEDANQALRLNPGYLEGYNRRAIVFIMKEDYASAFKDFYSLIALAPEYSVAYINRGRLFQQLGNHKMALDDFRRAKRLGAFISDNVLREQERLVKEMQQ